jgi:hypothetical protein
LGYCLHQDTASPWTFHDELKMTPGLPTDNSDILGIQALPTTDDGRADASREPRRLQPQGSAQQRKEILTYLIGNHDPTGGGASA